MSDWPRQQYFPLEQVIVCPFSPEFWGSFQGAFASGTGSQFGTLTGRLVYLQPFVLNYAIVVAKLGWVNHSTVNGTVDVGIYDYSLTTLLVSSGAITQGTGSTGNTYQAADVTDTHLPPGWYYAAFMVSNGSTGVYQLWQPSAPLALTGGRDVLGCLSYAHSADTLPSSITPAAAPNSHYPQMNLVLGRQL